MRSSEFWGWDFFLEKGYVETEKQLNEDKVGRNKYNDKHFARAMLKFRKKKVAVAVIRSIHSFCYKMNICTSQATLTAFLSSVAPN